MAKVKVDNRHKHTGTDRTKTIYRCGGMTFAANFLTNLFSQCQVYFSRKDHDAI